jgi:hypothetical protein
MRIDDGDQKYFSIPAGPAKGLLYVNEDNPEYISGHIRVRGRENGSYPFNYLEMIDRLFGKEDNTIEVCSGNIRKYGYNSCYSVDINPETNPDLVDDGQMLSSVPSNRFNRWRCDPPYNTRTAKEMYGTDLPNPIKITQGRSKSL